LKRGNALDKIIQCAHFAYQKNIDIDENKNNELIEDLIKGIHKNIYPIT